MQDLVECTMLVPDFSRSTMLSEPILELLRCTRSTIINMHRLDSKGSNSKQTLRRIE